jgi:hypothetical protein
VAEPVFAPQEDGTIAPQRIAWPAYWWRGRRALLPEQILKVTPKLATEGAAGVFANAGQNVSVILRALRQTGSEAAEPSYHRAGTRLQVGPSGDLYSLQWPAKHDVPGLERAIATAVAQYVNCTIPVLSEPRQTGQPYSWPIAHNVRPAAQSLGARGCTDCHANDAAFYSGQVQPAEPTPTMPPGLRMLDLRAENRALASVWSVGFLLRPSFKWFAYTCAALVALVFLRHVSTGFCGRCVTGRRASVAERLVYGIGLLALLALAGTGLAGKFAFDHLSGWLLFSHMLVAPLFVIGLAGMAALWARHCRFDALQEQPGLLRGGQKVIFWIALAAGLTAVSTMLLAMVPLFGTEGQVSLVEIHEYSAYVLLGALALHLILWLIGRRRPSEVSRT